MPKLLRRHSSPEDDARNYGPDIRGLSADGAQRVMTGCSEDPGTISNDEDRVSRCGYRGVDA